MMAHQNFSNQTAANSCRPKGFAFERQSLFS
jgi:hypothetical protein